MGKIARIYDPLGLVAPVTLTGKLIFRQACETKLAWDAKLPDELPRKLAQWEDKLPSVVITKRCVGSFREPIKDVHLHVFGDANGKGVAAAVYAVSSKILVKVKDW